MTKPPRKTLSLPKKGKKPSPPPPTSPVAKKLMQLGQPRSTKRGN